MVSTGLHTSFPVVINAGGALSLLFSLGVLTLYSFATYRIITKAGYSGWWLIIPFLPLVAWIVTSIAVVSTVHSLFHGSRRFSSGNFGALGALDVMCVLVPAIFYLIFAFSEWPLQRRQGQAQHGPRRPGGPPDVDPTRIASSGWQAPCLSCGRLNDMGFDHCPSRGVAVGRVSR
jgi:uncharacterized membrane protein